MRDGLRYAALLLILTLAPLAPALAGPAAGLGPDGALCRAQTDPQGRRAGMPAHMLTALSHVESGRWDSARQEKVAWPWTINAAGEGKIFPTKAAAIAEVRRLQAKGVRSIDVGCMQVNLYYHGEAFPTLEAAFDPATNVGYAVEFLTNLKAETGSWHAAAVRYHSATPEYANRYRAKLRSEWSELAANGRIPPDSTPQAAPPRSATLAQELAQARAEQARERAERQATTAREREAARAFAEAWRAERLAAYRRAKAEAAGGNAS